MRPHLGRIKPLISVKLTRRRKTQSQITRTPQLFLINLYPLIPDYKKHVQLIRGRITQIRTHTNTPNRVNKKLQIKACEGGIYCAIKTI